METDHQTYVICHCGTNIAEQPFEEIWNVLMPVLNHCEDMFTSLFPSEIFVEDLIEKNHWISFRPSIRPCSSMSAL